MKIISDFKDYYDAVNLDYGEPDKTYREKVYVRTTEEVKILDVFGRPLNRRERRLSWSGLWGNCLFVCGKAYPFLYERKFRKQWNYGFKLSDEIVEKDKELDKTFFSIEDFEINNKPENPEKFINRKFYKTYCRNIEDDRRNHKKFFDYFRGKDITELHVFYDCPILLAFYGGGYLDRIIKNPCLKKYGFEKVMSPIEIFQEIEMFLGNVLVKDTMPPSHQSDIEKIISHGFDPETSFRKPKNI